MLSIDFDSFSSSCIHPFPVYGGRSKIATRRKQGRNKPNQTKQSHHHHHQHHHQHQHQRSSGPVVYLQKKTKSSTMWRISAMAMRPKRAGTRRCWKDTTRAFSAIPIHTGQPQIQQREAASISTSTSISTSISITMTILRQKNQPLLNYQRSRYFHTSPFVGAKPSWELDNDIDIDPNDPDAIPDFLDDEDFANSLRENIDATIEENGDEEREQYRLQQQKVNEALDNRKGRPWRDPWEISEQQWMSSDTSSESLPDWSPSFVSRISLERLQILTIDEGMLRCVALRCV